LGTQDIFLLGNIKSIFEFGLGLYPIKVKTTQGLRTLNRKNFCLEKKSNFKTLRNLVRVTEKSAIELKLLLEEVRETL